MEYKDQLHRKIEISKTPKRIISLVPSQTELLVDLGLQASIVGITKFCVHPQNLREEKEIVGGTKQVNLDKIKRLKPDMILCNKEENTREMVAALQKIAPVHVSDVESVEGAIVLIEQYGQLFCAEDKAQNLIKNIRGELKDFQEFIKPFPKRKVAYFIWRKPWMVTGGDTFINTLLKLNNFENVYQDIDRYPEIKLKNLRELDYILLSSEPFPFQQKHAKELIAFVSQDKIKFVDGEFFSWYGSRLESAFRYFKKWHQAEL